IMTSYSRTLFILIVALLAFPIARAQDNPASPTDPLVRVLLSKGVLTAEEARLISVNATPEQQRNRLATLLRDKGVISAAEFEAVRMVAPGGETTITLRDADYKPGVAERPTAAPQPSPPSRIAAIAPVRLL